MEGKNNIYKNYSFPKQERLSSKKIIDALFAKGASFYFYPFSVRFLSADDEAVCHQHMASVSKRNFKRAVDRNRIKRLMKEAYRLNKHELDLLRHQGNYLVIAYIYVGKEIHPFSFVESKLLKSFDRLKSELNRSKKAENKPV